MSSTGCETIANPPRLVTVIPAFNPGPIVKAVVCEVTNHVDRIILIDDGSDPANRKYFEECADDEHVQIIGLKSNRGKGYALFVGLSEALKYEPDFIFTIDSDGQHNPNQIPAFKRLLGSSGRKYDLVIGTRSAVEAMPMRSKIGNIFTARLFKTIFRKTIADTQSGFRALSADFARDVLNNIRPGRFETEMKMLVHAVESDRVIGTVAIDTIYLDRNRNSKFRPIQDSARILVTFSKYAAVGMVSFLIDYAVFLLLTFAFGVHYLASHVVARIGSAVFNFLVNKHLVFKSRSKTLAEPLRYVGAVIVSMSTVAGLLYGLVELMHVSRAMAKPAAELTVFVCNFVILRTLVFRGRK